LGSAQTGTGKTAAYGLPLISSLLDIADKLQKPNNNVCALVLTPTRELSIQVLDTLKKIIGHKNNLKSALLIGGNPIFRQLKQLQEKPVLVVGTPGRVNDHLSRGSLNLSRTSFFVLDEIDRMLDMGFSIQLEKIAKFLPRERQTLMFSATISNSIEKMAEKYLKDAVRVSIGSNTMPVNKIKQEIVKTSESDKYSILVENIEKYVGSLVVFVKTKTGCEKLAVRLSHSGHEADAIHGDLRQRAREKVVRDFRTGKTRILVATDIAARGLDVPNIECVVNYDLPQCPEDYIHRIGRTGRAGADGVAVSLVTAQDSSKWRNICKMMDPSAKHEPIEFAQKSSRPSFNKNKKRDFGRKTEFGDRKDFGSKKEFGKKTEFSDKKDFGKKTEFGDKKDFGKKIEFGKKPSFGRKTEFGQKVEFGKKPEFNRNRKPRSSGNAA
jgi:superfamily II DNA/RNA helicase